MATKRLYCFDRNKYAIIRINQEGELEFYVKWAQVMEFRPLSQIKHAEFKAYYSEEKALKTTQSEKFVFLYGDNFQIIPVRERYDFDITDVNVDVNQFIKAKPEAKGEYRKWRKGGWHY